MAGLLYGTLNTTPAMVVPVFTGFGVLPPSESHRSAAFLKRGGRVVQQRPEPGNFCVIPTFITDESLK